MLINHIDYDNFGNILSQTNAAAGDRFTFTGREFDAETGLYYYRARYYDPILGRFLSQDPLGLAAGDANFYRYVGNSPLNATDPFGLAESSESAWTFRTVSLPIIPFWPNCFTVTLSVQALGSFAAEVLAEPLVGPRSLDEFGRDLGIDVLVDVIASATVCALFPAAGLTSASFGTVAVSLRLAANHAGVGANVAIVRMIGKNFFAFAQGHVEDGGTGSPQEAGPSTAPSGAGWFDDVARAATSNPDSDTLVLGHFATEGSSYQKVAAHHRATYFKVDDWNAVTKGLSQDEIWRINETFLDQQIKQGKKILFSHDPLKAIPNSFFEREVEYLGELGYSFRQKNQWTWEAVR
jgi:RHS repeat-associated protein